MNSTKYPEIVDKTSDKFIKSLIEDNFFKEYGITDLTIAKDVLNEWIFKFFLDGTLSDDDPIPCEINEMTRILNNIVARSSLSKLKKMGLMESYYDETQDDEIFWLTEKGKKVSQKLLNNDGHK